MAASFFSLERLAQACESRNFVCLNALAAVIVLSALVGWLTHPLIAIGLLLGLVHRIWSYRRGTLRPHTWSS